MPNIAQIFRPAPEGTCPVLIQLVPGEEYSALGTQSPQLFSQAPQELTTVCPQVSHPTWLESWGRAEEICVGFLHSSLGFSLLFFSQHQKSSSTFHVSLGRTWHRYHRARPAGEQLCCEEQRHEPAATGRPGGAHQCPIYLEDVEDSAHVPFCLHGSRSAGIRPWARQSVTCPLCRQPFHLSCARGQQMATKSTRSPHTTTATAPGPEGRPSAQLAVKLHWQSTMAEH